jgi:hypothetical protein
VIHPSNINNVEGKNTRCELMGGESERVNQALARESEESKSACLLAADSVCHCCRASACRKVDRALLLIEDLLQLV